MTAILILFVLEVLALAAAVVAARRPLTAASAKVLVILLVTAQVFYVLGCIVALSMVDRSPAQPPSPPPACVCSP